MCFTWSKMKAYLRKYRALTFEDWTLIYTRRLLLLLLWTVVTGLLAPAFYRVALVVLRLFVQVQKQ